MALYVPLVSPVYFPFACVLKSFLYLVWYTTMSILGHYNNFFFAAHLLDIAMGFKTLRTILSSVTHNGKQVGAAQRSLPAPGGVVALRWS